MPTMPPEYHRNYRKTVKARKERAAHQAGVNEGVAMCCKFLREVIGGRVLTGEEAAIAIGKALSSGRT